MEPMMIARVLMVGLVAVAMIIVGVILAIAARVDDRSAPRYRRVGLGAGAGTGTGGGSGSVGQERAISSSVERSPAGSPVPHPAR